MIAADSILNTGLAIAGVLAGSLAAVWVVIQLVTAGKGSFLKERNDELATALEQMRLQRDDDRRECQEEIDKLRDQVNEMRGELNAHRVEYARVIAVEVLKALETSPEWVHRVRGNDG